MRHELSGEAVAEVRAAYAVEAVVTAREASLRYVSDDMPGFIRRRAGKGFSYRQPDGQVLRDPDALRRIRALVIPPAWRDVWICRFADGHIQATGRDEKGRKQYRYHTRWREVRDATKFSRMVEFAQALPRVRVRIDADLRRPGLPREKVLAAVVRLLETTLIRIGNEDYAKQNESYGLTTLRNEHVEVEKSEMRFSFKGKSGKTWNLRISDRRLARIVRQCQELPGQELFRYVDEDGAVRSVDSSDVNEYLRETSNRDISTKDFRTWAGTILAALALRDCGAFDSVTAAKRNIRRAIEQVATRLGNTPTICRKCYVHPSVLDHYMSGTLVLQVMREAEPPGPILGDLLPEETAVLCLLAGTSQPERRAA
jgi:DNA topoisomerase-1